VNAATEVEFPAGYFNRVSACCLFSWAPLGMLPVQLDAMLSVHAGRYAANGFAMITHFTPRVNHIQIIDASAYFGPSGDSQFEG
jgi:hypothetical protein